MNLRIDYLIFFYVGAEEKHEIALHKKRTNINIDKLIYS